MENIVLTEKERKYVKHLRGMGISNISITGSFNEEEDWERLELNTLKGKDNIKHKYALISLEDHNDFIKGRNDAKK